MTIFCGCKEDGPLPVKPATKSAYVLPQKIGLDFSVERNETGGVIVVGSTNLPDGTKLGAEVAEPSGGDAEDFHIFVQDGSFRSEPFSNGGRPLPAGKRRVHMLAYFNGAWQTGDVLNIVGEGGAKLQGSVIKLQDSDVVDSDKILDLTKTVYVPPLAPRDPEEVALEHVKKATLTVDGDRSATNLEENVELFMASPGLRPAGGWSAKRQGNGTFAVTYDFIDGQDGEQQALWAYNPASGSVKYVNKRAKLMSWTPAD